MRVDLSAADFLIPETSYRVYCFAEDNWPTDAISASVRSQSYGGHPSMPNKVSLEDVLNFSSAGMFSSILNMSCWEEYLCVWRMVGTDGNVSIRIDTFHETTNFRMPGDTVSFIPSTLDISPPSFTLLEIQDRKFGRFAERSILKSTELGSPFYQDLCNRCHSRKRLCSNECLQNVFESSWSHPGLAGPNST